MWSTNKTASHSVTEILLKMFLKIPKMYSETITCQTGEYKVDLTRQPKFPLVFGELASGRFLHWTNDVIFMFMWYLIYLPVTLYNKKELVLWMYTYIHVTLTPILPILLLGDYVCINLFYLIQKIKTQVEQTTGDKITCNLKNEDQSSQKRPQRNVQHDSKQRNKQQSPRSSEGSFSKII